MHYNISIFNRKNDNVPKEYNSSWEEIVQRAQRPHIRAQKDGVLICGATFAHSLITHRQQRLKELANEASIIFGDIDHGQTFDQCVDQVSRALDCKALLYTTHSHQIVTDQNPEAEDRIRIAIPLLKPIPAKRFTLLWLWLQDRLGGILDTSCKDISRMVYAPAISRYDAPYQWEHLKGEPLNWAGIDLAKYEPKPAPKTAVDEVSAKGWTELKAVLIEKIAAHDTAKRNGSGKIDCRGVCHNGKGDKGLFADPAKVAVICNSGCDLATILEAFSLPTHPEIELFVTRGRDAQTVIIALDQPQAEHYGKQFDCSAIGLNRAFKYTGKKTVLELFSLISPISNAIIPITSTDRQSPDACRGLNRMVRTLQQLKVKVEVFEVKG